VRPPAVQTHGPSQSPARATGWMARATTSASTRRVRRATWRLKCSSEACSRGASCESMIRARVASRRRRTRGERGRWRGIGSAPSNEADVDARGGGARRWDARRRRRVRAMIISRVERASSRARDRSRETDSSSTSSITTSNDDTNPHVFFISAQARKLGHVHRDSVG